MSPERRAALTKLETSVLNTALNVGRDYALTGQVNTTKLIVDSIDNAAGAVQELHDTSAATTPEAVKEVIQINSDSKVVDAKIAPPVANAVAKAISEGAEPEEAAQAAARGLNKAAAKLKEEK